MKLARYNIVVNKRKGLQE